MEAKEIIRLRSKAEEKDVLKRLGEMGYRWGGSGSKAEDYKPLFKDLFLYEDKKILCGIVKYEDEKRSCTGYEWLEKNAAPKNPKRKDRNQAAEITPKILIYRNGNKTIARFAGTSEKAEARCNPSDEFDYGIGAMMALSRLFGVEPLDAIPVEDEKESIPSFDDIKESIDKLKEITEILFK